MFGRRKVLWFCLFHFSLLACFLSVSMLRTLRGIQDLPPNLPVGNRASDVGRLKETGFPFSFLVIGDTQGSRRGIRLIKQGLKEGRFSFMVHLGDFVKKPDRLDHLLALSNVSREVNPAFPIFLVPGNHDIDYAGVRITDQSRRVTREAFNSLYGARRAHFVFNRCLFVLTEIDPQNPGDYLAYLQQVLDQREKGLSYTFVFIHVPPSLFQQGEEGLPGEEIFFRLMETYQVTACFFGHYHGYRRGQRNGVAYLITGGGGRLKERQSGWGKFHHLLNVTVDETGFSENLMVHQDGDSLRDRLEGFLSDHVFPIFYRRAWVLYSLTAVLLMGGGVSLVYLLKSFGGKRGPRGLIRR